MVRGYNHVDGNDVKETFTPITYLEATKVLLAFANNMSLKTFSKRIKKNKTFVNGYIMEKAYVEQAFRFEDKSSPNHAYKLRKALYRTNKFLELHMKD